MNVWHDIDSKRINIDDFIVAIEISKGSKNKYELDKATGLIMLDRILYTSTHYPANYGFIPKTYADDDDPLDVLVLCSESLVPLSLVRCYPVGVIRMKDSNANDDKIIAIPFGDPNWNCYNEIGELPPHLAAEIEHFFQVYKNLEHKETSNIEVLDKEEAKKIIATSIENYQKRFKM